jgi:two-component system NtrC family sensor kinase
MQSIGWCDDIEAALKAAHTGAESVRRCTTDLQGFKRADAGKIGPVDVREVLEWALAVTAHGLRQRARIVKDFGETPLVMGDAARLAQAFVNVLQNASDSLDIAKLPGNEVQIVTRTHQGTGGAVIEVHDTGAGMPSEVVKRAFEPFFTTKARATGLGLSACNAIIRSLGGEIELESALGTGTFVRIVLPAGQAVANHLP